MIKFENSYYDEFSNDLSADCYQRIDPQIFPKSQLIYFNDNLAQNLGIDFKKSSQSQLADILSGNKVHKSSIPIALAYAGHQFGSFVPQLGDGRAILLGEIVNKNNHHFDMQLKGSGKTKYSRNGDGFATLEAALRELIIGEALHHLEIPTTRILGICLTNEVVFRQQVLQGAVMTRIADSYIRVGSFEYFAYRGDKLNLKKLCEYAIKRHFPQAFQNPNPVLGFYENVVKAQAKLIAKWQSIGFIHGVMNTDNMSICGQSIDFGPCAFLDEYDHNKVFSAIDFNRRYAFGNQSKIAKWNLWILMNCLALITDRHQELIKIHQSFDNEFEKNYYQIMARKLGFETQIPQQLIVNFLTLLQKNSCDYTQIMSNLSFYLTGITKTLIDNDEFRAWLNCWKSELKNENTKVDKIIDQMKKNNPMLIARNHVVAEVINAANNLDFIPLQKFLKALSKPFEDKIENQYYKIPPIEAQKVRKTFCGT